MCGFETFIVEESWRKGSMYKADNWTYVGETQGSTKFHQHGVEKKFERREVEKKLVYCKWIRGGNSQLSIMQHGTDQTSVKVKLICLIYKTKNRPTSPVTSE